MQYLHADWPAPDNIHALTTTRTGGVSQPPRDTLNLGFNCGDDRHAVLKNREQLNTHLSLPSPPLWLKQVHGSTIIHGDDHQTNIKADGSYTDKPQQVCAILTADCLPIFLCNETGTEIALLHAGWRGLAQGIITQAVKRLQSPPEALMAWFGPAIGATAFEVGKDVKNIFQTYNPGTAKAFTFQPERQSWLCNIYALAKIYLNTLGIRQIYGAPH